ncbi:hypothetical protein [Streptomyces sp. YIM 98790]|uniref:hypothetical protein n=1 Tax=Streptomyces sp. YIM 98790 TaxID=2689077 RepID=UPI0014080197|nr:hypothetical protein [Streptomyces sp. YIM 98790]
MTRTRCSQFAYIRARFERQLAFLSNTAALSGHRAATVNPVRAANCRRSMARALNTHLDRCRICR